MKVKDLIFLLSQIEDKEKDITTNCVHDIEHEVIHVRDDLMKDKIFLIIHSNELGRR